MDTLNYIIGLFVSALEDFIRDFVFLIVESTNTPGGDWDVEFRPWVKIAALILALITIGYGAWKYSSKNK
jgi:hypothetical protein